MENLKDYYNPLSVAKVLMTIGVIYVHVIPPSILTTIIQDHPTFNTFYAFITETLVRGCVPFYFFISGFMFFRSKVEGIPYKSKILSRTKRLLIPLLVWNTLFILLFSIKDCNSITEILMLYLRPANFPLWFLRDLFFISIITPLIGFLITKTKHLFLIIVIILYLITSPNKESSIIFSFTFFSLGAYISTDSNLFQSIIRKSHIIFSLFIAMWGLDVFLYIASADRSITHAAFKLLFVGSAICTLKYLSKKNKINQLLFLQIRASFFLYCTHIFYIAVLHLHYPGYYYWENTFSILLIYIFTPWAICICSYIIYYSMMKICPSVLQFSLGIKQWNVSPKA